MPASPSTTTTLGHFIPLYWDTLFGENLYPNLYLYSFGVKRTLPRNFGQTIKIPRLMKQNIVALRATEGAIVNPCGLSAQYVSGTLKQFAGAYKHTDIVIMTALSDVIELSLRDIARDIAKRMDTFIRDQLSGAGTTVGGSGGTVAAPGTITTTAILKGSDLLKAAVLLDSYDNPRPPDGHYPFVTHPLAIYNLQSSLTGNSWLEVNKYGDAQTVGNIYRGEMGRFFGTRVVTTTNTKRLLGSGGISSKHSGYRSFMFAPDSYYVTEISDMTAKTFVKQLGSGGTSDPVNQIATVGAKVFFTAFSAVPSGASNENRIVRVVHGSNVS